MILLSFDIEEFDMPLEYGQSLSFDDQLHISATGTIAVLNLLKKHNVKATFFCTANFALNKKDILRLIVDDGHEIASHGYYHSDFKPEHLASSKNVLEELTNQKVNGYRMARMMPFDESLLSKSGYSYNSSLNPTYLPGRYNNFTKPRTHFQQHDITQLPASVTPLVRLPLFWLSFHNLPQWFYKKCCQWTLITDGYLNIYFHPWEFTDLSNMNFFPAYVRRNSGDKMIRRMDNFISWAKNKNFEFVRSHDFVNTIK
ncbi:MAG TPA: polysaccharide deacetylase family protein [Cyclobacteriaceae bacterium]